MEALCLTVCGRRREKRGVPSYSGGKGRGTESACPLCRSWGERKFCSGLLKGESGKKRESLACLLLYEKGGAKDFFLGNAAMVRGKRRTIPKKGKRGFSGGKASRKKEHGFFQLMHQKKEGEKGDNSRHHQKKTRNKRRVRPLKSKTRFIWDAGNGQP